MFFNMQNPLQFFKRHALLSAVITLILFTGISAAAAELIAPVNYKPSKILGLTAAEDKEVKELSEMESEKESDQQTEENEEDKKQKMESDHEIEYKTCTQYRNIFSVDIPEDWQCISTEEDNPAPGGDEFVAQSVTVKKDDLEIQLLSGVAINASPGSPVTEFYKNDAYTINRFEENQPDYKYRFIGIPNNNQYPQVLFDLKDGQNLTQQEEEGIKRMIDSIYLVS